MKTKEITVTVAKTIQIVQYEPVNITVSHTANLDEDDDPQEASMELYKVCTKAIAKFLENEKLKAAKEIEARAPESKKLRKTLDR